MSAINMLTGLYEPSSGDASIYGMSLKSDMYSIRQFIGVCPQHDVLFGSLTVSEHLRFYGQLKFQSNGGIEATNGMVTLQVQQPPQPTSLVFTVLWGVLDRLGNTLLFFSQVRLIFSSDTPETNSGMSPSCRDHSLGSSSVVSRKNFTIDSTSACVKLSTPWWQRKFWVRSFTLVPVATASAS